jgi:hypothetical protein
MNHCFPSLLTRHIYMEVQKRQEQEENAPQGELCVHYQNPPLSGLTQVRGYYITHLIRDTNYPVTVDLSSNRQEIIGMDKVWVQITASMEFSGWSVNSCSNNNTGQPMSFRIIDYLTEFNNILRNYNIKKSVPAHDNTTCTIL